MSEAQRTKRRRQIRDATGRMADRMLDTLPDLLTGGGLDSVLDPEVEGSDMGVEDGDESLRLSRRTWRWRRRPSRADEKVRVIEPRMPGVPARLREFWQYRSLTMYFGRQQIEKLYRRTWLGWVWIPLRPAMAVGTRVLVFGGLLGAPSRGVPYLLFFLIGYSAWQFFGTTLFWATRSIEMGRRVLRRMYVPRLTCLVGSAIPSGLNLLLYWAIAAVAVAYFLITEGTTYLGLGVSSLLIPVGIALELALALSIGCFTSVYGAHARDVRFTVGYLLSFWFFLTPIIYPLSEVPKGLQTVASLNPMSTPIEMIRWGFFGSGEIQVVGVISTLAVIIAIGVPGLIFFNRSEAAALDSL